MIDSLVSSPTIRMLEQTLSFTEQRHQALLEDISNVSTPGYVQRDLSVEEFQGALRDAVDRQRQSVSDSYEPESGETIDFSPDWGAGSSVAAKAVEKPAGVPFHDRGVRSMEYLNSQLADNAIAHNMAAQFLKNRYDLISRAISMKV